MHCITRDINDGQGAGGRRTLVGPRADPWRRTGTNSFWSSPSERTDDARRHGTASFARRAKNSGDGPATSPPPAAAPSSVDAGAPRGAASPSPRTGPPPPSRPPPGGGASGASSISARVTTHVSGAAHPDGIRDAVSAQRSIQLRRRVVPRRGGFPCPPPPPCAPGFGLPFFAFFLRRLWGGRGGRASLRTGSSRSFAVLLPSAAAWPLGSSGWVASAVGGSSASAMLALGLLMVMVDVDDC